jgi:hypothetical protein
MGGVYLHTAKELPVFSQRRMACIVLRLTSRGGRELTATWRTSSAAETLFLDWGCSCMSRTQRDRGNSPHSGVVPLIRLPSCRQSLHRKRARQTATDEAGTGRGATVRADKAVRPTRQLQRPLPLHFAPMTPEELWHSGAESPGCRLGGIGLVPTTRRRVANEKGRSFSASSVCARAQASMSSLSLSGVPGAGIRRNSTSRRRCRFMASYMDTSRVASKFLKF